MLFYVSKYRIVRMGVSMSHVCPYSIVLFVCDLNWSLTRYAVYKVGKGILYMQLINLA